MRVAGRRGESALARPPPSCGEYTLDQGESIPHEAVDCMAEAGEDGATLTVTLRRSRATPS